MKSLISALRPPSKTFPRHLSRISNTHRFHATALTKMAVPISSPSPKLDRFQQAMESLYGRFVNICDPENWSPPLRSGGHRGRYLWTDAFGVINLLTMHKEYTTAGGGSDDTRYLALARRLIETVHDVLGRTRDNRSRLPGATDANPLGGGLRIGKTDEYGPDCDGQYHHYLTIWMFALNRMAMASGNMEYNRLAVQLARAIHPKFFHDRSAPRPRMIWKMSMDLSMPLVKSEGNLDPIDGFVVFRLLQATAMAAGDGEVLSEEIADYRRVMDRKGEHFVSNDPLDLGMTLWTAHWFSDRETWASNLASRCFEHICRLFSCAFWVRGHRYAKKWMQTISSRSINISRKISSSAWLSASSVPLWVFNARRHRRRRKREVSISKTGQTALSRSGIRTWSSPSPRT